MSEGQPAGKVLVLTAADGGGRHRSGPSVGVLHACGLAESARGRLSSGEPPPPRKPHSLQEEPMPPGWGLPQVHQGPAHGAGARGLVSDTSGLSLFLLHTQLFPSSVKFWEKKKNPTSS